MMFFLKLTAIYIFFVYYFARKGSVFSGTDFLLVATISSVYLPSRVGLDMTRYDLRLYKYEKLTL